MSGHHDEQQAARSPVRRAPRVRTRVEGGTGPSIASLRREGTSALAGAVLDLATGSDDPRIVLIDCAGAEAMTLGPFPEEDVIALWRAISVASGLTPMMRAWNGRTEPLACQLGRLRLGKAHDRKRLVVLNGRRPRFLVRRKSSRLPMRPLVFREREIAGGRGR